MPLFLNLMLSMKLFWYISLFTVAFSTPVVHAQEIILAEIDGEELTLKIFEQEYAKTMGDRATAADDSLEEYVDYLRRYVNFQIKLKEANIANYFNDQDLLSEINQYRVSFAKPYLIDNEVIEPIVEDLYQKRQEYIRASHIMVALPRENLLPQDTLSAWEKIVALRDSLDAGVPFEDLAVRYSEDPSASSPTSPRGYQGDLGYFTGGQMIEPFENAAYGTSVGELSDIVRSSYGYHILKVHDREDLKPDYVASHIMVRFPDSLQVDSSSAFAKIDSLKSLLDQGMSFSDVAMEHSEDQSTARVGGSLQGSIQFRNPNIDGSFHDALFALESPGDISDVVETPFGLHLIKLDEILPLRTKEQQYDRLARMAESLPRMRAAEVALADASRELYISKVDTLLLTRLIGGIPPDSIQNYLQQLVEIDSVGAMPLITLQDSVYTLKEFSNFSLRQPPPMNTHLSSTEQAFVFADQFLDDRVLFYRSYELEYSDPEFQDIMQNFNNGLAIFKIMEDSVWNASSTDTLRLQQHYEANVSQYQWPDRHRLIEISGTSDSLLTEATNMIDLGGTLTDLELKIASDSTFNLQLDTIRVAENTDSIYDEATALDTGDRTDIRTVRARRIVLYKDGVEPARPKSFEEAMTDVMADVQVLLEEQLHQRLREKYQVTTFPDRLVHAFQSE